MGWVKFSERKPQINDNIFIRRSPSFHRSMKDYYIFETIFTNDLLDDDMLTHWWHGDKDFDKAIKEWKKENN